jgi:hypothetical protein
MDKITLRSRPFRREEPSLAAPTTSKRCQRTAIGSAFPIVVVLQKIDAFEIADVSDR